MMKHPLLRYWVAWLLITAVLAGYLGNMMTSGDDQTFFLPGDTSHGHYQIEMRCDTCHTPSMGVKQDACIKCHGEELEKANDSHPEAKFTDPRNADRVKVLDARECITCHREHMPDMTHPMGVTMPMDYCARCHQDIETERPSHVGLGFETCATAGCHNYHDNRALYEDFLLKHKEQPDIAPSPLVAIKTAFLSTKMPLTQASYDGAALNPDEGVLHNWETTAHAKAGINCSDCHLDREKSEWVLSPNHESCRACHGDEVSGFLLGRHGMRVANDLPAMRVDQARQPMKSDAAHQSLSCASCHGSHRFDTRYAAAEACMQCHDDEHTRAYTASPHFALWSKELDGTGKAGSGVSCATCHMPRHEIKRDGKPVVVVQHNQNDNLRPNEKMIRTACMHCHGLKFSIDALADKPLIQRNFKGQPSKHIPSINWAITRDEK